MENKSVKNKSVKNKSVKNKMSGHCPICKGTSQDGLFPFCSKRCADIDLSRWFSGNYTVPVVALDEKDLDELERFVEGVDIDSDEPRGDGY